MVATPMQTLAEYIKKVQAEDAKGKIPDYMNHRHDWTGFDFDRTLATYYKWGGAAELGQPIAPIVDLLKQTHEKGNVKIFSARVWPIIHYDPHTLQTHWDPRVRDLPDEHQAIRSQCARDAIRAMVNWCDTHLGFRVPITTVKDIHCTRLYDDIAVQVEPNTGRIIQS
jgi:hypothetical protein